jgi:hypothetical protein
MVAKSSKKTPPKKTTKQTKTNKNNQTKVPKQTNDTIQTPPYQWSQLGAQQDEVAFNVVQPRAGPIAGVKRRVQQFQQFVHVGGHGRSRRLGHWICKQTQPRLIKTN